MKKLLILLLMVLMMVGCRDSKEIIIAEQYGLAYAPIQVMKARGTLEAQVDQEVKWVKMANTTALREALLAGQLDVGFLGIPPFIISYDNDVEWKMFTGLSEAPLGLMSRDIKDLESISKEDRIALPQPGSIQHILLAMAAEKTFGDAKYFDEQLVTMKHPDGMQALMAGGDITLHYTSPPFIFEEEKTGMHTVIDSETCMGEPFTFIVGVTTEDFEGSSAYKAFNEALTETIAFMYEYPEATLEILKTYYDYDEETLRDYVYNRGIVYTQEIKGVEGFVDFMYRNDYIKNSYEKEDLTW